MIGKPIGIIFIACIAIRAIARMRRPGLTAVAALGFAIYLVREFICDPGFQEFAADLGSIALWIIALPFVLFGLIVVIAAPIAKGGRPPEFF